MKREVDVREVQTPIPRKAAAGLVILAGIPLIVHVTLHLILDAISVAVGLVAVDALWALNALL